MALMQAGFDAKLAESVVAYRAACNLDGQVELMGKYRISAIPFEAPGFPRLLTEAHDCPALIYVRGELTAEDQNSIAVVGTRKFTAYGKQVAEELAYNLASNKLTVVSGLAKGIDTFAHRSALEAGGRTIAVFASGLDIVYPSDNLNLARRIIERGALVSEFPLGTKPRAENFPRRNRILSGLSRGVVVIESGETGGALLTANFALEQNREVFAVPGSIFSSMSKGPNMLINEGAKVVRSYHDILEELNLSVTAQQITMKDVVAVEGMESVIMKNMSEEPTHIDEICRKTRLTAADVMSTLAMLELHGLIKHWGGMTYALSRTVK